MSGSINGVNAADPSKKQTKQTRIEQIVVKPGDTVSALAKKFGMSVEEFKNWTGLKKNSLNAGQKINLPMAEIPKGKGIMALIRENNMTLEEFGKLNNLPKPYKDYKASVGEKFYIVKHSKPAATSTGSAQTNTVQKPTQNSAKRNKPVSSARTQYNSVSQNKTAWNSSFTPDELSSKIYDKSSEYWGAVGKPDFDALISEINEKNAAAVINAYTKNPKNDDKESLINTITSEVRSDKNKRKAAVMHIYDALAKQLGTPASVREGFVKELNDQFSSFGMVNTKKLDETINRMMASPEQLAAKMEKDIDSKSSAVGKESFNELLSLVNSKNAAEVIQAYNKLNTGESLIEGITSEIGSSKEARKKAVMHIYDALAAQKNIPASQRESFVNELNKEFNSFGMVNTKKLDEAINKMLESQSVSSASASQKVNKKQKSNPKAEVHVIKGGFETAVGGTRKVSHTAAKPPIPVDENGKVISEVIKFSPSSSGSLSGYTIMVNAGHGWGGTDVNDARFKPGARYRDVNGKMLEEWYKNRNFADNLIEELTRNGATVIYTTGDAKQACDAKEKFKADMLVSLHCNAVDNNTQANGLKIIYDGIDSQNSNKFAEIMKSQLKSQVNNNCSAMTSKQTQHGYIGLIDESNRQKIPAVMLEMGFMSNPKDKLNIDSRTQRKLAMENVTIAIMKYFNVDYKNYNE